MHASTVALTGNLYPHFSYKEALFDGDWQLILS
jgi:hypothetical protein